MKIMHFIAASAIALGMATSAKAADVIANEEPAPEYAPPAFTWSGFYIGAQAGYGWGKSRGAFEIADFSTEVKPSGWLGGVYGGYNWEAGSGFVIGAEADIVYSGMKKDVSYVFAATPADTFREEVRARWEGAVRARAGYAVDRFLPYIAGGFAFGKVEHDIRYALTDFEKRQTRTGWTIGGGVDYAATDNLILRLEYRYVDLGKEKFTYIADEYETKFKAHEVRLGVAYKF
jgi:outer membrane immunogenic protein